MKTSLPAMVFTCTLVCTSQLVNASAGCAEEEQRNTALGHAIGVLVFDNIVKEYSEFATVEDIAAGLKHASNRTAFPLSSKISIESDPDAKNSAGNSLSVSAAQSVVTNWRPQSDQMSQRFLTEYKKRGKQKESGILTRPLELDDDGVGRLSECISNFSMSTEGDLKQVCYMKLQIDIESVCDAETISGAAMTNPTAQWTYGEFNLKDVIEGWVEVFKLLETDSEEFKQHEFSSLEKDNGYTSGEGARSEKEFVNLIEVAIPPELAYGVKGMVGKVEPNETLWFLMAVK